MYQNGTDKYELSNISLHRATGKVQRALNIEVAIEFFGIRLMLVMDTRGKMHNGIDTGERGLPLSGRTNRPNDDFVVGASRPSHRPADNPSLTRQRGREMTADETACTRD
jgi:hypothetical protein